MGGVEFAALMLGAAPAGEAVAPVQYQLPPPPVSTSIVPQGCGQVRAGEILVCARRSERDRLEAPRLPPGTPVDPDVLTFDVGGAEVRPVLESFVRQDGYPDRRIMINVKIPFWNGFVLHERHAFRRSSHAQISAGGRSARWRRWTRR